MKYNAQYQVNLYYPVNSKFVQRLKHAILYGQQISVQCYIHLHVLHNKTSYVFFKYSKTYGFWDGPFL